jgi:hypothetical protein
MYKSRSPNKDTSTNGDPILRKNYSSPLNRESRQVSDFESVAG